MRSCCRSTYEASCSTHPLLPGRDEVGGRGAEDSPAGPLPWGVPASGRRLARLALNLERHSASKRARRSSSYRSREEDAAASPLVGWSGKAVSSSEEESKSTMVLSERLRRVARSPDSASLLS
jgi:hypothetical protein